MKNVLVFCSANEVEEKYTKPCEEFGKLLAEAGFNFVWGGSDTGLMKVMASTAQENGGKIIGISVEFLRSHARKNADEMIITKDLRERKETMLARSDSIVVLIGGIGTLDEITEILELKKHKVHEKPIVFLNTENFYEGFKIQLQKMEKDGFLTRPLDELVYFADTPEEAITYLKESLS